MKNLSQMFLLALGFILFATTAQSEIKPKMTQFEALMKQLSPYLMSEKEYSNPDNYKKVEAILKEINVNLTELMKDPAVLGSNYKFRFKVLADGFKDVEQSYQNRFLDYSFWNLKSQLYQCSSCHTEKQMVDRWYSAELANHSDLFAQADFQFMLRGYEGAVEKYQKLIKGYPKNKLTEKNLDHAVKKIGYYYLRILQNDEKTLKAFSEINQNKEIPIYLARHLKKWIEYFNVKKFRMLPEKSEDQSLKKLKEFIEDREVIANYYGTGDDRFPIDQETLIYLHRVLDLNQNKEISPWLYFWIGKLQNNYKESLFDNTGELFLKECFSSYPKSKVAKLCKAEHKAILDSRDSK
jgi:tetratricopeptide (TPR) repeat protein